MAQRILRAFVEAMGNGWLQGASWAVRIDEPTGVGLVAARSAVEQLAAIADVWGAGDAMPGKVIVHIGGDVHELNSTGPAAYEIEVAPSETPMDKSLDLLVRVEPYHGPWHKLPCEEGQPTIVIRSASLPVDLTEGRLEGGARRSVPDADGISRGSLSRLLAAWFAKREFYPIEDPHPRGQERAIRRLLGGRDTVVLLPTGAGKSLIYQMAGLLLPGRVLIIDPIVALIDDQVAGLAAQGIDRVVGITRADTAANRTEAKLEAVKRGEALFCFVAPERLQQRTFREALRSLTVAAPVGIAVVDEAHCVSEWGHDFRTAYLDLGRVIRTVAADQGRRAPALLGLTGTASRSVLRDMLIELDIDRSDPETIITATDFDRRELRFNVIQSDETEVVHRLIGALNSLPSQFDASPAQFFGLDGPDTYGGIVFTQTVNPSRRLPDGGIIQIARQIQAETGAAVGVYAGSQPREWVPGNGGSTWTSDWESAKREFARAFKANELSVLVATKAYGMGIDKPNIRFTVHVGVPGSIEGFYQEAGRAGRDRSTAHCVIVHDPGDRSFHDFVHENNFRGTDADTKSVEELLELLHPIGERRTVQIPRAGLDTAAQEQERAIHRLKLLGVVRDYLVDWGAHQFEVMLADVDASAVDAKLLDFVRRTEPGRVPAFERAILSESHSDLRARVIAHARRLIDFVYETIVESRRRALDEMVQLADSADGDGSIRDRILRYLELGSVSSELEPLVGATPFRFESWQALYAKLSTVDDAREWRGATARFLESSPDQPGLLAGRALAEAAVPDGQAAVFTRNLSFALESAQARYSVDGTQLADFSSWLLTWVHARRPAWSGLAHLLVRDAIEAISPARLDSVERQIVADVRIAVADELGYVLAQRLDRAIDQLRSTIGAIQENL